MNYIWGGMIVGGVFYGVLTGRADAVSEAVLSSAKEAVTLCIAMLGAMGLWTGLMEIAKDAGILQSVSKRMRPLFRFLFPDIPEDHPAKEHIAANCVANMLGLGSASTVYGLKAMEALEDLEEERRARAARKADRERVPDKAARKADRKRMPDKVARKADRERMPGKAMPRGTASNEMCTFLILNISSLQLIPVNIIAYRSQYGSVNPTAIVGPGIAATAVSTVVAVVFCKGMSQRK